MLALLSAASAYNAPLVAPVPAMRRAVTPVMDEFASVYASEYNYNNYNRFDLYGEQIKGSKAKPPLKLLSRIEELQVLSGLAEAGVLSSAEEAGIFSKLERAGAYSSIEKLLPLADDLKLLSTAEALLNVPAGTLIAAAAALVVGEVGLISVVPDDSGALVALQVGSGAVVGLAAVVLLAVSSLFSVLQGKD